MKVNEFTSDDNAVRVFNVLLDPLLDPPERVLKYPGVPQVGSIYTKNGVMYKCINVKCEESDDYMSYDILAYYEESI